MLNRFLAAKQDEQRGPKARRPYLATECTDLNEADRWRQQILREIGRKVMEIQNAGLGEHRYVCVLMVEGSRLFQGGKDIHDAAVCLCASFTPQNSKHLKVLFVANTAVLSTKGGMAGHTKVCILW